MWFYSCKCYITMCREAVSMWRRCKVEVKVSVSWTPAFWGGAFTYISLAFEQIWAYSTLQKCFPISCTATILETWNIFIYWICRCPSPLPPLTHCCPSICNIDLVTRTRNYYCIHCKYLRMPSNQSLRKTRYRAVRRRRKYFEKNHSVELREGDKTMEIRPSRFLGQLLSLSI